MTQATMLQTTSQFFAGVDLGSLVLNLILAVIVLIVGYLVAKLLAALVRRGLRKTSLDERLGSSLSSHPGEAPRVGYYISRGVFWLVMIFVVVAFLQVLNLSFVTEPLNRFLGTVMAYLPQLIAAAVLVLVAWIVATVLRLITRRVLKAANVDERVSGSLKEEDQTTTGERMYSSEAPPATEGPAARAPGEEGISVADSLATAVYYLVWLLFLPAILSTLELEGLLEPVENMVNELLNFLPNLLAAAIIGLVGYFIAKLIRSIVVNLLAGAGFDRWLARLGLAREEAAGTKRSPSHIVGTLVMVAILLFTAMEAAETLGLSAITALVAEFLVFAGEIIIGLIIFGLGLYLANLAYRAVQGSNMQQAAFLAVVARVAIIILAGAMALRQMGLANSIINLAFGLTLGAVAVAAAIAFGLGGRDFAHQQLERMRSSTGSAPDALKPSEEAPGKPEGGPASGRGPGEPGGPATPPRGR